jgi:hypothetical protein
MGEWNLFVITNLGFAATLDRSTTVVHDGNYSAHISVTAFAPPAPPATGSNPGGVVFFQLGLPLVQGTTYLLQFWATSSNARTLPLVITKGGRGKTMVYRRVSRLGPPGSSTKSHSRLRSPPLTGSSLFILVHKLEIRGWTASA